MPLDCDSFYRGLYKTSFFSKLYEIQNHAVSKIEIVNRSSGPCVRVFNGSRKNSNFVVVCAVSFLFFRIGMLRIEFQINAFSLKFLSCLSLGLRNQSKFISFNQFKSVTKSKFHNGKSKHNVY